RSREQRRQQLSIQPGRQSVPVVLRGADRDLQRARLGLQFADRTPRKLAASVPTVRWFVPGPSELRCQLLVSVAPGPLSEARQPLRQLRRELHALEIDRRLLG